MTMVINGSGTITGLTAGGLPDATIVQADLATGVAGTGPLFIASGNAGASTSSNVATLTAAIQEQQVLINQLTTRLEALEAK